MAMKIGLNSTASYGPNTSGVSSSPPRPEFRIQMQSDGEKIQFGLYSEKERKNIAGVTIDAPDEVAALYAKLELLNK